MSQKWHLWRASTLKSLSGGMSFQNLVWLGSLSFGVLRDFIPINSGPVPSNDAFHFVICFSKFLGAPKQSFRQWWLDFSSSLLSSESFVSFLLSIFLLLIYDNACLWLEVWLSWWEQCGHFWESEMHGGEYAARVVLWWALLGHIGVALTFSGGFFLFWMYRQDGFSGLVYKAWGQILG